MSDKKIKRVAFTFDERSKVSMQEMTAEDVRQWVNDVAAEFIPLPPAPTNTAVLTHLRAALKALDEHHCTLVEREIREAMGLL